MDYELVAQMKLYLLTYLPQTWVSFHSKEPTLNEVAKMKVEAYRKIGLGMSENDCKTTLMRMYPEFIFDYLLNR